MASPEKKNRWLESRESSGYDGCVGYRTKVAANPGNFGVNNMRAKRLHPVHILILLLSTLSLGGCGASVQDSATGRGTVGFAQFACEQNGFSDADFRILWARLSGAGSGAARADLITRTCSVSDTPCIVCMFAIAETFN